MRRKDAEEDVCRCGRERERGRERDDAGVPLSARPPMH